LLSADSAFVRSFKDDSRSATAVHDQGSNLLWSRRCTKSDTDKSFICHFIQPANFLAHYLGHEGEGSVLSYLKKKGWVNELSAGPSEGATGWGFFRVSLDLTPEGLGTFRLAFVSTPI
jgi:hypothetical protein